jgi:hypothetical protein
VDLALPPKSISPSRYVNGRYLRVFSCHERSFLEPILVAHDPT